MSLEDLKQLFEFIGGLGLFLYGMNIMADGLQKAAGGRMKRMLGYITNNRLLGVLLGALITAIIQSSSATTVMVVGFVNAGILSLSQAVGVIMGANIGTTITAWLVSMSEWGEILKPEILCARSRGDRRVYPSVCEKRKTEGGRKHSGGLRCSVHRIVLYVRLHRALQRFSCFFTGVYSARKQPDPGDSGWCDRDRDHSELFCFCGHSADSGNERRGHLEFRYFHYPWPEYRNLRDGASGQYGNP